MTIVDKKIKALKLAVQAMDAANEELGIIDTDDDTPEGDKAYSDAWRKWDDACKHVEKCIKQLIPINDSTARVMARNPVYRDKLKNLCARVAV